MKNPLILIAIILISCLFNQSCVYKAPLDIDRGIPVDTSLVGLWEPVNDSTAANKEKEALRVVLFSPSEYLVHYMSGDDDLYFRAYHISLGGVQCIQVEFLNAASVVVDKPFTVYAYSHQNEKLLLRSLNNMIVNDSLESSKALRKEFLDHLNDKELFTNAEFFQKVRKDK